VRHRASASAAVTVPKTDICARRTGHNCPYWEQLGARAGDLADAGCLAYVADAREAAVAEASTGRAAASAW
jgi:hypothetical protein